MNLFSRDDVVRLLHEVSAELSARDVKGHIFIVGGAAMALAYGRGRLTHDIDAVFEPTAVVYEAAQEVAERHGLADSWLNDAVKGFLPGEDPNATTLFDEAGLAVRVASPGYLFTMKALAARVERDAVDLVMLYRMCGYQSIEEALGSVQGAYPDRVIPPRMEFILRELLTDQA